MIAIVRFTLSWWLNCTFIQQHKKKSPILAPSIVLPIKVINWNVEGSFGFVLFVFPLSCKCAFIPFYSRFLPPKFYVVLSMTVSAAAVERFNRAIEIVSFKKWLMIVNDSNEWRGYGLFSGGRTLECWIDIRLSYAMICVYGLSLLGDTFFDLRFHVSIILARSMNFNSTCL